MSVIADCTPRLLIYDVDVGVEEVRVQTIVPVLCTVDVHTSTRCFFVSLNV